MKTNGNRVLLVGFVFTLAHWLFVFATSSSALSASIGGTLGLFYLLFVAFFAEVVRKQLYPEGMTLKEAGYGKKEYKFLEDKERDIHG